MSLDIRRLVLMTRKLQMWSGSCRKEGRRKKLANPEASASDQKMNTRPYYNRYVKKKKIKGGVLYTVRGNTRKRTRCWALFFFSFLTLKSQYVTHTGLKSETLPHDPWDDRCGLPHQGWCQILKGPYDGLWGQEYWSVSFTTAVLSIQLLTVLRKSIQMQLEI